MSIGRILNESFQGLMFFISVLKCTRRSRKVPEEKSLSSNKNAIDYLKIKKLTITNFIDQFNEFSFYFIDFI
jgi:hypothetical protein